MLHEISRKGININKYEGTTITWNDSVLTIRGNKELHLLDFSYNLGCLDKRIDFKERTVCTNNNSPLSKNYLTKYITAGVKNLELVEMVNNPSFWPHNNLLLEEMTTITVFQWSPFDILNVNNSLLSTINSCGNVEFFGCVNDCWSNIMNFSSEMKKHLKDSLKKLCIEPQHFSEVKETVYNLATSSLCWGPLLNNENSCYFVTAQKSGMICFWLIHYNKQNIQIQFCGSIQTAYNVEIVHMLWIPKDESKFLLVYSNELGEIISNECEIIGQKISLLQVCNLWLHKDKMVATYPHYHFENNNLILLFVKHRHIVIQMYDKNLKLLSQHVQNVNDYKITCLTKNNNVFYLTTINTKIYKVNYTIVNETLNMSLTLIEVKETLLDYELFGIAASKNGALFALALISRKLLHRKQSLKIEIVFLSSDVGLDNEVSKIISNPLKKLTHLWDVIEVLRCKILKIKKLPDINYNVLLKDDCDMYNLKVYLIFLHFYHNLERSMTRGLQGLLAETSLDVIKERILMLQAYNLILNTYEKFQNDSCLTDYDLESFEGCKKYLSYYCKKYSKNKNDLISTDILKTSNVKFNYLCQCCDEELVDVTCKYGHVNMICSHTLTPIGEDYFFCRSCDATSKSEMIDQNPLCVFCDLHLKKCF